MPSTLDKIKNDIRYHKEQIQRLESALQTIVAYERWEKRGKTAKKKPAKTPAKK